jgi:hypothetical protein
MPHKDPEARRAYARANFQANREKRLEYLREWKRANRLAHPEKVRAQARAYQTAHPVQHRAYRKAYRQTHPEQVRKHKRLAHLRHGPQRCAYSRHYYATHLEQGRTTRKTYRVAHPEIDQMKKRRRRAQKAGAPRNDLTHAQWIEIQETQDHRCYYCHVRCKGKLTQDHLTPLSQGGSHTLHNVIGACRRCNAKKFTGPPLTPVQPLLLTIAAAKKKKAS